jgi:hypothetical protein
MLVNRYEVLKNQALQEPLIWTAQERGDVLIGAFISYKQGVLLVQDVMGVIHRVSDHILSWYSWLQLNEPVRVCTDDLISIQYIGIDCDSNEEGGRPIFKVVIDRATDHIYR